MSCCFFVFAYTHGLGRGKLLDPWMYMTWSWYLRCFPNIVPIYICTAEALQHVSPQESDFRLVHVSSALLWCDPGAKLPWARECTSRSCNSSWAEKHSVTSMTRLCWAVSIQWILRQWLQDLPQPRLQLLLLQLITLDSEVHLKVFKLNVSRETYNVSMSDH